MRLTFFVSMFAVLNAAFLAGIPASYKAELGDIGKKIGACKAAINSNSLDGKKEEIDGFEKALKALAAKAGVAETDSDIARQMSALADCRKELEKRLAKKTASAAAEAERAAQTAKAEETLRAEQAARDAKKAEYDAKIAGEQAAVDDLYKKTEALYLVYKDEVIAIDTFLRKVNDAKDEKEFFAMLSDGMKAIERAKEILPLFGDRKGLQELDKRNAEAKSVRFFSAIGFLPGIIEDIERKRLSGRSSLLYSVGHSLSALKSANDPRLANQFYEEIKETFAILDKLFPGDEEVAAEKKTIRAEAKEALAKVSQRIADARMAKDAYGGADGNELRETMKKIHSGRYPEETVLRVVITDEAWVQEARAEVNQDGKIVAGVYKFIGAEIATKDKGGCMVRVCRFRRTWTGTGDDFGPVELHSIGGGYRIFEENVLK
jgi:hypothetical protein